MRSKIPETSAFCEVRQAAIAIGCSEKHVYELVRNGRIKAIRIGSRGIRIDRQSVEHFIRENLIDPVEYYA